MKHTGNEHHKKHAETTLTFLECPLLNGLVGHFPNNALRHEVTEEAVMEALQEGNGCIQALPSCCPQLIFEHPKEGLADVVGPDWQIWVEHMGPLLQHLLLEDLAAQIRQEI